MENEKKNIPQSGTDPQSGNQKNKNKNKRHKSPHRKGYFIEPANGEAVTPKTAQPQQPKRESAPTANAEKPQRPEGEERKNNDRPHKNHNRKKSHHKSKANHQEQTAQAPENQAPKSEPKKEASADANRAERPNSPTEAQNKGNNHQNNRRRKGNKPHHGSKEKNVFASEGQTLSLSLSEEKSAPTPFDEQPEEESYSIEDMTLEEILGEVPKPVSDTPEEENGEPVATVEVVGVRFKSTGKIYYFDPNGVKYKTGAAIVETARGLEYGEVVFGNRFVKESETVPPLRPVIRAATEADIAHHKENKEKEDAAFKICNEKIIAHGLDMKLIDVQYTFDNTKLLFYFTSAGRVDFRELVKDLASVFRTRIELRQIGIRDEAKMMGGLGPCGRSLCCSLFLSDFGQVSIKMAKEQNLSLNSSKISGVCGRLMCCLRYEYETYDHEIKLTPPVESIVKTADGMGTVTEINPLAGTIKVRLTDSPDTPPKQYHRDDVTVISKKQPQNEE